MVLSGLYQLGDALDADQDIGTLLVSTFFAFLSGYVAIAGLLRFLVNHSTIVFVVYRVGLGVTRAGARRPPASSSRRSRLRAMSFAWKFGIVALVALALTALPGGGGALRVALTLLSIAFFTAIAYLGYRLYRQYGFELDSLSDRARFVLYGSVALAFLTFCATNRMFDTGGLGRGRLAGAAGHLLVRRVLGVDPVPPVRLTLPH